MPGRNEPLDDALAEVRRLGISTIVSLADLTEIRVKSPAYADAIETGKLTTVLASCPIPDRGVPDNRAQFTSSVEQTVSALEAGQRILVHCGAGVGRTGTYAAAILVRLGLSKDEAIAQVDRAGSRPETTEQLGFVTSLT